ncbi:ABC transporter permease [Roseivirga sp.]|uniref:ABC transporter permease n=1 Tax=Roseivirga sp. TaxID=1964215 RepID=UPI003B8DC5EE
MSKQGSPQNYSPPRWLLAIIRFLVKPEYLEEIEGDLEEVYYDFRIGKGKRRSDYLFLKETIRILKFNLIKPVMSTSKTTSLTQLFYNIKFSYRSFSRHKTSFFINIVGLSTALAAALVIFLWVNDEKGVDAFHTKNGIVYQVLEHEINPEGLETSFGTAFILSDALKEGFPETDKVVTVGNGEMSRNAILSIDDKKTLAKGIFASQEFFETFSFPLASGTANEVLSIENSIVLSETVAISLFGSIDKAIGQSIKGNRALYNASYIVTGVFENIQSNSTIQFEYVANHRMALKYEDWLRDWYAGGAITYLTLNDGTDLTAFNQKLRKFIANKPGRADDELEAYPFKDLYLKGEFNNGIQTGGRISYVRIMTLAGVFILFLASINFMNLATAQASKRLKEVGVKKVFGVKRKTLIAQFLTESFLITSMSLLVALGLVALLLPQINLVIEKELSVFESGEVLRFSIGTLLIISFLSGLYPAFYLSKFNSKDMIRGKLKRGINDIWIRKGLVVLQFSVSTLFVTGFLILNNQIEFIREVDLGYNRDNLIHFTFSGTSKRKPFLDELNKLPNIVSTTSLYGGSIAKLNGAGGGFSWGNPVEDEEIDFRRPQVSYDFFETLKIPLVEGRTFSRSFQNEENTLIINQAAADLIGIKDIVGKTIMDGSKEKQVIGIVENFKIQSLYEPLQPAIVRFIGKGNGNHLMVKITNENQPETIKAIEALYNKFGPEYPFNPRFVNDQYDQVYNAESKISILSAYFTIVAILIACLGLFGLATYNTERRIKEVGIRKVLGSSTLGLVRLLSADFIMLVTIALVVALPVSYFAANNWLDNFAIHYEPGLALFAIVISATLILSITTVGLKTLKTANANPVDSLRTE